MLQMKRHNVIPPGIMDVRIYAPQAAAVSWWLSGGISAGNANTSEVNNGLE